MPNHFHLLLKEIRPGGITTFMRKLGTGFTNYKNIKDGNSGKIFQGSYKAKTIKDEAHLLYVDAYIQVFNPFQLSEIKIGQQSDFDRIFEAALDYKFSSLGEVLGKRNYFITDRDVLSARDEFKTVDNYKAFTYDLFSSGGILKFLDDQAID